MRRLDPALGEVDKRQYAVIIRNNCSLLHQIIDDTLDLAKIEAGKLKVELLPCQLRDLIRDLAMVLGKVAREKGIRFTVDIDPGVPPAVLTDAVRLRRSSSISSATR